jgi:hypothetical protein
VLFLLAEVVVGKGGLWQGASQDGAAYQSLPTGETKPKTNGSCMWNTLPNLTGSCARGANQLGGFGLVREALPTLTMSSIWLHRRSVVPLPIITSRGVKYTHNDHEHSIPHPDSGPARIRPIPPERHQSLEVDHTHHTR